MSGINREDGPVGKLTLLDGGRVLNDAEVEHSISTPEIPVEGEEEQMSYLQILIAMVHHQSEANYHEERIEKLKKALSDWEAPWSEAT